MRQIYTITAMQIVTSESNPQGVYSAVTGYPIKRDSRDYEVTAENPNGNEELALIVAQADYANAVQALSIARNRAGWAVTLERWDGVQLAKKYRKNRVSSDVYRIVGTRNSPGHERRQCPKERHHPRYRRISSGLAVCLRFARAGLHS